MEKIIIDNVLEYCNTTQNIHEAIYYIDGLWIDGEFDYGYRGLDHNTLLGKGYGWEEVLTYGVVIVPESSSYISDEEVEELENIGYNRLPLNNNHIVGWKN